MPLPIVADGAAAAAAINDGLANQAAPPIPLPAPVHIPVLAALPPPPAPPPPAKALGAAGTTQRPKAQKSPPRTRSNSTALLALGKTMKDLASGSQASNDEEGDDEFDVAPETNALPFF